MQENQRIEESCLCGATFVGTGYAVDMHAEKFREAHRVCRERLQSRTITTEGKRPVPSEDEVEGGKHG